MMKTNKLIGLLICMYLSVQTGFANAKPAKKHSGEGAVCGRGCRQKVSFGKPEIPDKASIDSEAVQQTFKDHGTEVLYCYEKEFSKRPKFSGHIVGTWKIDSQGTELEASFKDLTLHSDPIIDCVAKRTKTWRFPKATGKEPATVTLPITFSCDDL